MLPCRWIYFRFIWMLSWFIVIIFAVLTCMICFPWVILITSGLAWIIYRPIAAICFFDSCLQVYPNMILGIMVGSSWEMAKTFQHSICEPPSAHNRSLYVNNSFGPAWIILFSAMSRQIVFLITARVETIVKRLVQIYCLHASFSCSLLASL
jgi:hypothetical protein